MTLFCVMLAGACGVTLVYLDETHAIVRPWLAIAGVFAGIVGAVWSVS